MAESLMFMAPHASRHDRKIESMVGFSSQASFIALKRQAGDIHRMPVGDLINSAIVICHHENNYQPVLSVILKIE